MFVSNVVFQSLVDTESHTTVNKLTHDCGVKTLVQSLNYIRLIPATPFYLMISFAIWKGFRLILVFPACYLLFWMTTLVVSMGWITADATLPEREPIMKGFPYLSKKLSEDISEGVFEERSKVEGFKFLYKKR